MTDRYTAYRIHSFVPLWVIDDTYPPDEDSGLEQIHSLNEVPADRRHLIETGVYGILVGPGVTGDPDFGGLEWIADFPTPDEALTHAQELANGLPVHDYAVR
jgi:hypothetical protein